MTVYEEALQANAAYASSFNLAGLAMPPAKQLAVVACIDARLNVEILGRLGMTVVEIADEQGWELHFSEISKCDLIVDAIFGTGLKEPLAGMLETVAADINSSGIPVTAIDLPSGLSADRAEPIGGTPERFAQFIRDEGAKWSDIVKQTGAKVD